jgi:hypothetical protein
MDPIMPDHETDRAILVAHHLDRVRSELRPHEPASLSHREDLRLVFRGTQIFQLHHLLKNLCNGLCIGRANATEDGFGLL